MLVWRILYWINQLSPNWYFLNSHHLFSWHCIDIVRRKSVLVTNLRVNRIELWRKWKGKDSFFVWEGWKDRKKTPRINHGLYVHTKSIHVNQKNIYIVFSSLTIKQLTTVHSILKDQGLGNGGLDQIFTLLIILNGEFLIDTNFHYCFSICIFLNVIILKGIFVDNIHEILFTMV